MHPGILSSGSTTSLPGSLSSGVGVGSGSLLPGSTTTLPEPFPPPEDCPDPPLPFRRSRVGVDVGLSSSSPYLWVQCLVSVSVCRHLLLYLWVQCLMSVSVCRHPLLYLWVQCLGVGLSSSSPVSVGSMLGVGVGLSSSSPVSVGSLLGVGVGSILFSITVKLSLPRSITFLLGNSIDI